MEGLYLLAVCELIAGQALNEFMDLTLGVISIGDF
jgi:hypothetical protein